ncbi:MAG: flagellar hook-length control protein FliK [Candidatus Zixiibacteriota bacterium]
MNPILDIIAKATNTEAQAQTAAPTKGDGLNPFTQVFAQAVAATNESPAAAAVVVPTAEMLKGETQVEETSLAAQLAMAMLDPALTAGNATPTTGEIQTGAAATAAAANGADATVIEAMSAKPAKTADGADVAQVKANGSRVTQNQMPMQAVNFVDPNAELGLSEQVQRVIENELSANTKQESAPVTINTRVEITNEALTAVAAREVPKQASQPTVTDGVRQTDAKPSVPSAISLKAQMRKSFATADIKSASTKATVQVKLNDAQVKNATPVDVQVAKQEIVKTVELPIASARQIAMATINPGIVRKLPRGEHQAVSNSKHDSELGSSRVREDKIATRIEAKTSMRKPVQIALKSQGFDLDKLAASTGRSEASTLQNVNLEKADTMAALEKPAAAPIDRSLELNGMERFKLEIKRGHIEALLKKGEVRLQLQPEHLGNLKVKLITTPTNVSARLETSSEEARRAVEASLPQLRESFERAGLKLGSIEVIVNQDNDQQRQHAFQQNAHGRSGGARRSLREFGHDIPVALTEIANTQLSAYGGALNLVA